MKLRYSISFTCVSVNYLYYIILDFWALTLAFFIQHIPYIIRYKKTHETEFIFPSPRTYAGNIVAWLICIWSIIILSDIDVCMEKAIGLHVLTIIGVLFWGLVQLISIYSKWRLIYWIFVFTCANIIVYGLLGYLGSALIIWNNMNCSNDACMNLVTSLFHFMVGSTQFGIVIIIVLSSLIRSLFVINKNNCFKSIKSNITEINLEPL